MLQIKNIKIIAMLILSIAILDSCSKDSSVAPSKSRKEMISGVWLLDSSLSPNSKGYEPPPNGKYELTLAADGNFNMKDDKKIALRIGTWKLRDNDANVQLTIINSVNTFYSIMNIAKITDTNMKLEYTDGGYLFIDYYTKIK